MGLNWSEDPEFRRKMKEMADRISKLAEEAGIGFQQQPCVWWTPRVGELIYKHTFNSPYGPHTYDLGPVKPLQSESDAQAFHDEVAAFLRGRSE